MVYEILSTLMLPLLVAGAAGIASDMPTFESQQEFHTTSIIQIPKPDGTQYWRYIVSGIGESFTTRAFDEKQAAQMRTSGYPTRPDYTVTMHTDEESEGSTPLMQYLPTHDRYNGTGITIAIIDSGVDFSNMDIRNSLARDEFGFPIMLDADGQGIVLTNATFKANIDKYGKLRTLNTLDNTTSSSVYLTKNGVFLDMNHDDGGTVVTVYNGLYPYNGLEPTFNATVLNDMKIGKNSRDYILSQSGIYRLGFLYQPGPNHESDRKVQVVPMLMVDSEIAGIYDTVIPDMSTSWKDYNNPLAHGITGYDFDFTDEHPIRLGEGKEFLVYDADGDGTDDYSAGVVGARVVDVFGIIDNKSSSFGSGGVVNGTLLPAMDADGEFFGVMSDVTGHGSLCAATIASSGTRQYDIYENGTMYSIRGVAPGVSIIPVKSLWQGNIQYSAMWSVGFDSTAQGWTYSGKPRAEIVSNSWGIPTFPVTGSATGLDDTSIIYGAAALPGSLHQDHPGTVMISSLGNDGHGYGSIAIPSASPFVTAVGATTSNLYTSHGMFSEQPRFGNTSSHGNDVAHFSSRGPSIIGDPKPNIMATGAYAFVPAPVTELDESEKLDDFDLFGGTSMAAPIIAGTAAVLLQVMFEEGKQYDPFTIKNILASTADDASNDPFVQGSGIANITRAVEFAIGDGGSFLVYNDATYPNLLKRLKLAYESLNITEYQLPRIHLPDRPLQQYEWFAGYMFPGERSSTIFTVENPSNYTQTIDVKPVHSKLIAQSSYNGTTKTHLKDPIINGEDAFAPQYILLSDIRSHSNLVDYFTPQRVPESANLLILHLRFSFDDFMNKTNTMYADKTQTASLYLYDWNDKNNDTEISSQELSLINRGAAWGNVQEMRVADPASRFEGIPVVGIFAPPHIYSYWTGTTEENATSMNYTITTQYYRHERWSDVWLEDSTVEVPARGSVSLRATLTVPTDYQTGVYQGSLKFQSNEHTSIVPVSYTVKTLVEPDTIVKVSGDHGGLLFDARNLEGATSLFSNYASGAWRQFYFQVNDPEINLGAAFVSWIDPGTQITVFVVDPLGKLAGSTADSGVFEEISNSVSSDWLGPGMQGHGGFYPVTNINSTSVGLYIPVNQTGVWSILAHSSVYGGKYNAEPVDLSLKFTNLP
ncbi:MAG: peptidase S8 [Cenarchaeum symbiont of Oopsacas minuta]|nr:peptidase S8 [Cenarchaeum symbiont of Oopsacas minuta]